MRPKLVLVLVLALATAFALTAMPASAKKDDNNSCPTDQVSAEKKDECCPQVNAEKNDVKCCEVNTTKKDDCVEIPFLPSTVAIGLAAVGGVAGFALLRKRF